MVGPAEPPGLDKGLGTKKVLSWWIEGFRPFIADTYGPKYSWRGITSPVFTITFLGAIREEPAVKERRGTDRQHCSD